MEPRLFYTIEKEIACYSAATDAPGTSITTQRAHFEKYIAVGRGKDALGVRDLPHRLPDGSSLADPSIAEKVLLIATGVWPEQVPRA